ncbi:tRNA (guanine-N(7)-)-methyltransferase non-catalytic subunit wdr4-like [Hydractinia symbiolongicarpus]|uniref:tRNA (guanine-N(7)-)-methyltransferase non-catalytic subunit wdr4-like n=1 Tax=Hydractinia symbiolongicarpus TaxID=13093 RepID=UPI00254B0834|nr:tRNA (guanine-N(7)-)-methyltransferase non-catalytic subunit wdr4-like [Hydractinia symbiolongicarpus]
MAHISSDGVKYLAISVDNAMQVFEKSSGTTILQYTNEIVKENSNENDNNKETSCGFICHCFSKDGEYLAAITENKKVLVWKISEKKLNSSFCLPKRPTCLDFCHNENTIVAGDKYGDIYRCMYNTKNEEPKLLLGHLSMVLTVKMTQSDKFIITGDRDEKIRVSCYPNAYTIHLYCLGHTKLVSCLLPFNDDILLSASADSTVKCWNFKEGTEISSLDIARTTEKEKFVVSQIAQRDGDVFVIGECSHQLVHLTLSENNLTYKTSFHLPAQPYSICFSSTGEVVTLLKDTSKPFYILQKYNEGYVEKESSIHHEVNLDHLPEPKYYTQLVKPLRGKRPNAAITPESTINLQSASKIVKSNHENIVEE